MSLRLPVVVCLQYQEVTTFGTFNITSFIDSVLINVYMQPTKGRFERSVFCVPYRIPSIRVLVEGPDEPVIDLTVNSTRGVTTLSTAAKIAACM